MDTPEQKIITRRSLDTRQVSGFRFERLPCWAIAMSLRAVAHLTVCVKNIGARIRRIGSQWIFQSCIFSRDGCQCHIFIYTR